MEDFMKIVENGLRPEEFARLNGLENELSPPTDEPSFDDLISHPGAPKMRCIEIGGVPEEELEYIAASVRKLIKLAWGNLGWYITVHLDDVCVYGETSALLSRQASDFIVRRLADRGIAATARVRSITRLGVADAMRRAIAKAESGHVDEQGTEA